MLIFFVPVQKTKIIQFCVADHVESLIRCKTGANQYVFSLERDKILWFCNSPFVEMLNILNSGLTINTQKMM